MHIITKCLAFYLHTERACESCGASDRRNVAFCQMNCVESGIKNFIRYRLPAKRFIMQFHNMDHELSAAVVGEEDMQKWQSKYVSVDGKHKSKWEASKRLAKLRIMLSIFQLYHRRSFRWKPFHLFDRNLGNSSKGISPKEVENCATRSQSRRNLLQFSRLFGADGEILD